MNMKNALRYFLPCLCVVALRLPASGQNVDSLEHVVATNENDSVRIRACLKLTKILRYQDPERSKYYARKGITLEKRRPREKRRVSRCIFALGLVHLDQENVARSAHLGDSIVQLVDKGVAPPIALIQGYNLLGMTAQQQGKYERAMQQFVQTLNAAERLGRYYDAYISEINIATILTETEKYREAIQHNREALQLFKRLENIEPVTTKTVQGVTYSNLAYNFNQLEETDSARVYLRRARDTLQTLRARPYLSDVYFNMGESYLIDAQFDSALFYYRQSIGLDRSYNPEMGVSANQNGIGRAFLGLGQLDSAAYYLEGTRRVLEAEDEAGLLERMTNYKYLSLLYEQKEEPVRALFFYKKYKALDDSLLNENRLKQVDELQTRYQTERKERENALLKLEAVEQEQQLLQTRWIAGGVSTGLLAALGFLLFVFRSRRKLSRKNAVIASKNSQLATLIQDHHHRFKNQYQLLIGLMQLEAGKGLSRELFKSYRTRIKAMGDMEKLLARRDFERETTGDLELTPRLEAFRSLFLDINQTDTRLLSLIVHSESDYTLPLSVTGNLMLVIGELCANAVKHNETHHRLELQVYIWKVASARFCLEISDNGSGWGETNPFTSTSVGWQIVQVLIAELPNSEATHFDRGGAGVRIEFDKEKEKSARLS